MLSYICERQLAHSSFSKPDNYYMADRDIWALDIYIYICVYDACDTKLDFINAFIVISDITNKKICNGGGKKLADQPGEWL